LATHESWNCHSTETPSELISKQPHDQPQPRTPNQQMTANSTFEVKDQAGIQLTQSTKLPSPTVQTPGGKPTLSLDKHNLSKHSKAPSSFQAFPKPPHFENS
jgi:hypothetical protein